MTKTVNWIHISDLHYGQSKQDVLFSKLKSEFFSDIQRIKGQIGKIDIVFFTGDLTQSGKKTEYDQLTAFLHELWDLFYKLDSKPLLIAIPGNHDVERQDATKSSVRGLIKYHTDTELQSILWDNLKKGNDYYDLINTCFKNFVNWYNDVDLPKPKLQFGLLPGDISTTLDINGLRINCLGLNTAFLDISNDDFYGKLAIHNSQVTALTGGDHFEWLKKGDISLLLTHHNVDWLDKASLATYNSDINPPNAFFNHLCGHVHIANSSRSALLGSPNRRVQLAPSLFGMQKVNGEISRIHGYYAGSYKLDQGILLESFYPRIVHTRYDGDYSIIPDHGFNLNDNNCIISKFNIENSNTDVPQEANAMAEISEPVLSESNSNILDLDEKHVDLTPLDLVPKLAFKNKPHHASVRLVEQKNIIYCLNKYRYAWLTTDWGLDENGFIGSVTNELNLENPKISFVLNCEDIITTNELLSAVRNQFGLSLQNFCGLINSLGNVLIVLKDVDNNLVATQSAYNRFIGIINSILDYSPRVLIVITIRQAPENENSLRIIKLTPFDIPQTKSYLENHTDTEDYLIKRENLEKIYSVTGGLPRHIDRILEGVQVASLEEVFEAESETTRVSIEEDPMPKSLINAISSLSDSKDKYKQRSFKLLKVLTILSNGETFENLKRITPTEPLYPNNANELQQLSLLEVSTVNRVISQVKETDTQQFKLLKVPRQIRDYVNTLITNSEKEEILKEAYSLYFGPRWRDGEIKNFHSSTFNGKAKFQNFENCPLLLKHVLQDAKKSDDDYSLQRAANLAINYCDQLYEQDDFKNALNIAEDIYHSLKPTNLISEFASITKLYGRLLRMNSNRVKAIEILNEALEFDEDIYSKSDLNAVRSDLAYAFLSEKQYDNALIQAKAIEKATAKDSMHNIQAKYVIARASLKGEEVLSKLRSLENQARKKDFQSLANNITMTITTYLNKDSDSLEKSKRLSKVVESKTIYTRIRAIISKASDEIGSDADISDELLLLLTQSYSYLYSQRMENMFSSCHRALWTYCLKNGMYSELLNLFRFSSFYWRIFGEVEVENEYFMELKNDPHFHVHNDKTNQLDQMNRDYFARRNLELTSGVKRLS